MTCMKLRMALIAGFAAFCAVSDAAAQGGPQPGSTRKEDQSAFGTTDGGIFTSTALVKLLRDKLGSDYQDLELVFDVCQSGEFATRLKATLPGDVSIMTASDTDHCASHGKTSGDKDIPQGPGGTIAGVHIDNHYYHGFAAQYVGKLQSAKNTVSNKTLFDTATANNDEPGENPRYASSGKIADDFTIHGGKTSNHALVISAGTNFGAEIADGLVDALKGAGYANADISRLGKANGTKAKIETAIADLGTKLSAHKGEEKGLIYIDAHGSYSEKTVAYAPNSFGTPGGGATITGRSSTVAFFADNPTLIADLQEELPRSGGGFWRDDPLIQRDGSPYITFTTNSETFAGPTAVDVTLDGLPIGTITMGNSLGADYKLSLSDLRLDQLMPDILNNGFLDLGFVVPSSLDSFSFAVTEDWLQAGFPSLDYGINIGAILGSETLLPEPAMAVILVLPPWLGWRLRRRR